MASVDNFTRPKRDFCVFIPTQYGYRMGLMSFLLCLVGWAASVLVYALIAFPFRRGRLRIGLLPTVFFALINLLSFTSAVMNDIAVVTSYCVMTMLVNASPIEPSTSQNS